MRKRRFQDGKTDRMGDILRRKIRQAGWSGEERAAGADHGWPLALARAVREGTGLLVEVGRLSSTRRTLAELLELPPERALVLLLDGPAGGQGLIALSPGMTAALVGMQAVGRIPAPAPAPRRPTRVDAAMIAGVIDHALEGLEETLATRDDLVWAGGFRHGAFLEDARTLGLLLEDQVYRVLDLRLSPGTDGREESVLLALPAEGRGPTPATAPPSGSTTAAAPDHGESLASLVLETEAVLKAVIARVERPLAAVMTLAPGEVLPLDAASLDRITLQGADGRDVATARLGQSRGMRAVRLAGIGAPQVPADATGIQAAPVPAAEPGGHPSAPLRATG